MTKNSLDLALSYPTANPSEYSHDSELSQLSQLINPQHIVKIKENLGIFLYDSNSTLSNLLIINQNTYSTHSDNVGAITIGDNQGVCYAVDDIQTAIDLHINLTSLEHEHRIIIAPTPIFNKTVKEFASKEQVTIFCPFTDKDKYLKAFSGQNMRLLALIDPNFNDVLSHGGYASFDEFLTLEQASFFDCRIGDLSKIKLGSLRDDIKQTPQHFPLDNFSLVIKNAILAISEYTQATIEIATMSVLGALTAIAQRTVSARFTYATCPVSLFLLTEAESGTGKTACLRLSYYAIERFIINQELNFDIEKSEWQSRLDKISDPSEKTLFLRDNPPPRNPNFISEDATLEALFSKFVSDGHQDLVWQSDDAGVIFGGHSFKSDRQNNVLANLTNIYSKQIATRLRQGETSTKEKRRWCNLTMDLMGQNVILEPLLSDPLYSGQGFLARFLFVKSHDNRGERIWNDINRYMQTPEQDLRLLDFWKLCDSLLDPLPTLYPTQTTLPHHDHRFIIEYDSQAVLQYHIDYQQRCETEQKKNGLYEFDKEIAGRMAENACRLATIFAFSDKRKTTTIKDYEQAIGIVDYCMNERLRYFKETQSTQKNEAELMVDWLIKYCKDHKTTEIGQRTFMQKVTPKKLRTKDIFWQNLHFLAETNHVFINSESKLVNINPQLLN